MKLVRTYDWSRTKREYDISTVVEVKCSSDADSFVERARDVADRTSQKLGALVEMLHARGVLSDADVLSLLGSFEAASTVA